MNYFYLKKKYLMKITECSTGAYLSWRYGRKRKGLKRESTDISKGPKGLIFWCSKEGDGGGQFSGG